MKVALFVPCYVDQFYPQVAIATLGLLERLGLEVAYPPDQTCCGQPMANSGFEEKSRLTAQHTINLFQEYDYVVGPSGSCVYHIRKHYDILPQTAAVTKVRKQTYELCQFLVEVLGVTDLSARFPHRVGLHQSCHGLRGLRQGQGSERVGPDFSLQKQLLQSVAGLELVELNRQDECCGFGGTFAVAESAVSVRMGQDRLQDHLSHEAEVITGADMSCLMHLQGLAQRQQQAVRILHIAEILNAQ